ncbi:MAG: hypothetical protein A2Y03_09230 [Omnitrophica WOR_2 bacterium GWF2_38_59]|nr:MAG: hypothetical protein A2Y03_09230 [Omnitrophica WOR_2 bacterium GWF2_38_59]OGX56129.1 MAG: hypothetical protein A2447_07670 [Omnitrophica WOR_2 bacterium RIFOXYC2_FULL_38_12]OGX60434.1 MAG: hypothetical protein A2306_09290 [Omnitrophica WOR_2 bacterium RIFOXYB2_FULL_38_16]
MYVYSGKRRFCAINRLFIAFISFSLLFSSMITGPAFAQSIGMLNLPVPGTMVVQSQAFVPVLLKGMTIYPDDPLKFDFIVDSGNTDFDQDEIQKESEKLVKYFLASMTVPKDDLWVNLSPYEGDRIITDELGKTELGRDLLAQDYILKQLTASLMYPEDELGREFWERIYEKVQDQFGTSDIPVNTFNKVWILPESATVYENGHTVFVVESKLKVMLDSDYQAMMHSADSVGDSLAGARDQNGINVNGQVQDLSLQKYSNIVREILIPEIEKEVNEGKNFAPLRQIYNSLILAKWYKETIKDSLLSSIYIDQNKTAGVELDDTAFKEEIYQRYLKAYKKGVFDYIKEDYDALTDQVVDRKYFSGGFRDTSMLIDKTSNKAIIGRSVTGKTFSFEMGIKPEITRPDVAMLSGKRILVVDGDDTYSDLMEDILERENAVVVTASDGQQALVILKADRKFDLVLADLDMPNMSGDQLARMVNELAFGIPVVLQTWNGSKIPQLSESLAGIARVVDKGLSFDLGKFYKEIESSVTQENALKKDAAMLSGKRILVVDDSDFMLKVMKSLLEGQNAEVVTAADGKDALDILKDDSRFDLIVSDFRMPIVKGDELAQVVKDSGYGIPVLIQTTNTEEVVSGLSKRLSGIATVIDKGDLGNLYKGINGLISPERKSGADRSMLSGKRILVVDDYDSMREGMEILFRMRGAVVVTASNGQEALDILAKDQKFDLIMTDYQMPVMDGVELAQKVSETKLGIPVLMQTAKDEEIPRLTEELSGVANVIKKGLDNKIIVEAVANSIEGTIPAKKDSSMLAGKRVLVVDDYPGIARMIQRVLGLKNIAVVTANNGQEALDILAKDQKFDLIMTDYQMPVMDGVELAKKVSESKFGIPVLMQTAREEEIPRLKEDLSGVATIIKKGFGVDALVEAIAGSIKSVASLNKEGSMLSEKAKVQLSQMHVTEDDEVQLRRLSESDWYELIKQINQSRVVNPVSYDVTSDIFGIYVDEEQSGSMTQAAIRKILDALDDSFNRPINLVVFTDFSLEVGLVYEGLHNVLFVSTPAFLVAMSSGEKYSPVIVSGDILSNNSDEDLLVIKEQLQSATSDNPQAGDVGGIDMNSIDFERTGEGVKIEFSPSAFDPVIINMGIEGFSPVIINLTPLNSVFPLLGFDSRDEDPLEISLGRN